MHAERDIVLPFTNSVTCFVVVSHAPVQRGRGPKRPQFFWDPYVRVNGYTATKFVTIANARKWRCLWVSHAAVPIRGVARNLIWGYTL